ncbi:BadF/BadG/BcrA/BcrD ATPase family protein [Rhodocaloribacter sp.]
MPPSALFIGLDAGGTKTELLARNASGDTFSRTGPPANLQRLGPEATARVLADLIDEARRRFAGARVRSVCAGVAGAGREADRKALSERLRARLGDNAPGLVVVSDARIALEGAFEGESGVIVIAGTGSMVLARDRRGGYARAGGWGRLLGDDGSGYAVGRAGLRALAAAFDGGPETRLRPLFAEAFDLRTPEALIRRVYAEGWSPAEAAPLVLEAAAAGDAVAAAVVDEESRRLARQAGWLAHRTGDLEPRFALIGGMTRNAFYRDRLRAALLERLPGWRLEAPHRSPVEGALLLASRNA